MATTDYAAHAGFHFLPFPLFFPPRRNPGTCGKEAILGATPGGRTKGRSISCSQTLLWGAFNFKGGVEVDLGLIELNLEEFKLARKMYQDAVNALDECIDMVEKKRTRG